MVVTVDDKLKVIMKDPRAVEAIDAILPGFSSNKQLKLVYGMTLRDIASLPSGKMTFEDIEKVETAFAAL
jgi:hypothetical protein